MRKDYAMTQPSGDSGTEAARRVAELVADVPDFPQPGILFKDLTPLFADPDGFREVVDAIVGYHGRGSFDVVAGIEARGFMIAAGVAYAAGAGVVPIRKAGKLPRAVLSAAYALEYGEAVLEVHEDAFAAGSRVLVVDDVLATGGTAAATIKLIRRLGGDVRALAFLIELEFLNGRAKLGNEKVFSVLKY